MEPPMSKLLDLLFSRSEDPANEVKEGAKAGLLDGEGPSDVAEVEVFEYDEC